MSLELFIPNKSETAVAALELNALVQLSNANDVQSIRKGKLAEWALTLSEWSAASSQPGSSASFLDLAF